MGKFRHLLAATLLDAPRFERRVRGDWRRIHNRGEAIRVSADGGVACDWKFTSAIDYCRLFPSASSRLIRAALRDWPIAFADAPERASGVPEVSFLIGHRGAERLPHLLLTLQTIASQRDVPVECIVVEQSPSPEIKPSLPDWVEYLHQPAEAGDPYRRAATFNEAARAARGRILVLHDNDMLVPESYAAELVRQAAAGLDAVDLKRFIFYLTPVDSARVFSEGRLHDDARSESVIQNLRGGSIAITAGAYAEIGGFDETFVGWGGEDLEFWERAETRRASRFGYLPIIHLWHKAQPEKGQLNEAPAVKRYYELANVPAEERIARLQEVSGRVGARPDGDT